MLALFRPPPEVIADALTSVRRLLATPPAAQATTAARLSTGDAFPPQDDDDDDKDVGMTPLEAAVDVFPAPPMFRLDANLARSSAS